jgi:hypothetical protein
MLVTGGYSIPRSQVCLMIDHFPQALEDSVFNEGLGVKSTKRAPFAVRLSF